MILFAVKIYFDRGSLFEKLKTINNLFKKTAGNKAQKGTTECGHNVSNLDLAAQHIGKLRVHNMALRFQRWARTRHAILLNDAQRASFQTICAEGQLVGQLHTAQSAARHLQLIIRCFVSDEQPAFANILMEADGGARPCFLICFCLCCTVAQDIFCFCF